MHNVILIIILKSLSFSPASAVPPVYLILLEHIQRSMSVFN